MTAIQQNVEVKVSSKGQIIIPAGIRRALDIDKGDSLMISFSDNKITVETMPTNDEWSSLFSKIPTEIVALDEKGQYNPKKSPDFHDWMVNG